MTALDRIKRGVAEIASQYGHDSKVVYQYVTTYVRDPHGRVYLSDMPLITCKDCKHEYEEWGHPYCCRIPTKSFETHGDNFCGFAERSDT